MRGNRLVFTYIRSRHAVSYVPVMGRVRRVLKSEDDSTGGSQKHLRNPDRVWPVWGPRSLTHDRQSGGDA